MSGRCSLIPILRLLGHGFLACTRSYSLDDTGAARRDAAKQCFGECAETRAELA